MDKNGILHLLSKVGSQEEGPPRTGWVIATCPFRHWRHDKGSSGHGFGVKVEPTGKSHYNCFACDSHGDLMDLVLDLQILTHGHAKDLGLDLKAALQLAADEENHIVLEDFDVEQPIKEGDYIFPEPWLQQFPPVWEYPEPSGYLLERGDGRAAVSYEVADFLDLRWDAKEARVCFPIRNWQGFLVGFHGRAILHTADLRYRMYVHAGHKNPHAWLGEDWVDMDKPILLVESVFDLASVLRVYKNSMCGLTAGLSADKIKRIGHGQEYVTLYDTGTGGDTARKKLAEHLSQPVTHLHCPEGRKDPGDMSIEELAELLDPHLKLDGIS